jgi:hypothetical protein
MSEDRESLPKKNHLSLVKMPPSPSEDVADSSPLKPLQSNGISSPIQKSEPSPRHYFTAEVRKRSPYDFVMAAHDPFHFLHCELPLKFEQSEEALSLVCQFPTVCDEELIEFVEEDEDLLGIVLITFHMHILQNLFSFCAAHKVKNLIIKATEEQFKGLGIYQEFIKHVDKIPTKNEIAMEITLPVRVKACRESMDDMTTQFRQTLWQDYSSNPAIRNYLVTNVRLSIVG